MDGTADLSFTKGLSVGTEPSPRPTIGRGRGRAGAARTAAAAADPAADDSEDGGDEGATRAIPAARRRRAAEALIAVWLDVTRDVALVGADGTASVRDPDLLEESRAAAAAIDPAGPAGFLAILERGAELVAGNVSPELVLDSLVLAWPERRAA